RPIYQVGDAQGATQLRRVIHTLATEALDGRVGLDGEPADLSQAGDYFLRESLREIDVGRVVRDALEVQHRQGTRRAEPDDPRHEGDGDDRAGGGDEAAPACAVPGARGRSGSRQRRQEFGPAVPADRKSVV